MSKREVYIKIVNLDKLSYVEKCFCCDVCLHGTMDRNIDNCPVVKRIANEITQTQYNIDGSKLSINTATYNHDFRRALDVVRHAIDARCHKR